MNLRVNSGSDANRTDCCTALFFVPSGNVTTCSEESWHANAREAPEGDHSTHCTQPPLAVEPHSPYLSQERKHQRMWGA